MAICKFCQYESYSSTKQWNTTNAWWFHQFKTTDGINKGVTVLVCPKCKENQIKK